MECRISLGTFNASFYNIWTCSLCYTYLFPNSEFKTSDNISQPGLRTFSEITYHPDVTSLDSLEPMCSELGTTDCDRWKDCCEIAVKCCERQLENTTYLAEPACPSTWDGWTCFDVAQPSSTVQTVCPRFLKYGNLDGKHGNLLSLYYYYYNYYYYLRK